MIFEEKIQEGQTYLIYFFYNWKTKGKKIIEENWKKKLFTNIKNKQKKNFKEKKI